jgi:hypothetical protein
MHIAGSQLQRDCNSSTPWTKKHEDGRSTSYFSRMRSLISPTLDNYSRWKLPFGHNLIVAQVTFVKALEKEASLARKEHL